MKIKISNLGKISEAIINPKPLTLFIGKNGSGKTYSATAIWAVVNYVGSLDNYEHFLNIGSYINFLKNVSDGGVGDFHFKIGSADIREISKGLQILVNRNLSNLLKDSIGIMDFSNANFSIEVEEELEIEIKASVRKMLKIDDLFLREELEERKDAINSEIDLVDEDDGQFSYEIFVNGDLVRKIFIDEIPLDFINDFLKNQIQKDVNGYSYFGLDWKFYRNSIYLPAARTGIMLAMDYYVEGALNRASLSTREKLKEKTNLPLPLRDFARRNYMPSHMGSDGESKGLLRSLIQGNVLRRKRGEFYFRPDGCDQDIPLCASSSLVTELSGFYLLGEQSGSKLIIFEEPEAHLHLEAQREIAKYLVSLVNKGIHLIITTHSDTFIQQLNNLIALSDHPNKYQLLEEFDIRETETLNREAAIAYDFYATGEGSSVKELKAGKTGFVAESLNDVLIKLANETYKINSDIEEDD